MTETAHALAAQIGLRRRSRRRRSRRCRPETRSRAVFESGVARSRSGYRRRGMLYDGRRCQESRDDAVDTRSGREGLTSRPRHRTPRTATAASTTLAEPKKVMLSGEIRQQGIV